MQMEIVTWDDYVEQRDQSLEEASYNVDGFDFSGKCHSQWSHDNYRYVQLQPGLWLDISDEVFHRTVGVKGEHEEDFQDITSKFYLSGNHLVTSPPGIAGVQENYVEQGGQNYLFYLPDIWEIEQYLAGDHIQLVKVVMNPDFLRTFCAGTDTVPQQLRLLLESNSAPRFHRLVGGITPTMGVVLQHILQAPYQGMIQKMYLEAKVLELLALQLAQLIESEQGKQSVRNLKPAELQRIYQAKEILIRNWNEPPSLMNLAQQVRLYHMKLKQGFRQVFGTTPFGYLHDYRMERARQLLQDEISIAAVVNTVGYSNPGHFAAAFKRKFGTTPSTYLSGKISG